MSYQDYEEDQAKTAEADEEKEKREARQSQKDREPYARTHLNVSTGVSVPTGKDDFDASFKRLVLNHIARTPDADVNHVRAAQALLGLLNKEEGREYPADPRPGALPATERVRHDADGNEDEGAPNEFHSFGAEADGSGADAEDVGTHSILAKVGGAGDADPKHPLHTGGIVGQSYANLTETQLLNPPKKEDAESKE